MGAWEGVTRSPGQRHTRKVPLASPQISDCVEGPGRWAQPKALVGWAEDPEGLLAEPPLLSVLYRREGPWGGAPRGASSSKGSRAGHAERECGRRLVFRRWGCPSLSRVRSARLLGSALWPLEGRERC